jgi:hypothetical protein
MNSSDSQCPSNPPTKQKELLMTYVRDDRGSCTNCAGEACQCGCRTAAAQLSDAREDCKGGTKCGCDAAEQGCLCQL